MSRKENRFPFKNKFGVSGVSRTQYHKYLHRLKKQERIQKKEYLKDHPKQPITFKMMRHLFNGSYQNDLLSIL